MFNYIRPFALASLLFGLAIFSWSCNKPEHCEDPIIPVTNAGQLIAYLDALEQVLYYVESFKSQLQSGEQIREWTDEGVLYAGYDVNGEAIEFVAYPVVVSPDEIGSIAETMTALFHQQISVDGTSGRIAPSRTHAFMSCGTPVNTTDFCKNNSDGTSYNRKYQSINRCQHTGRDTDTCTEYELLWYTDYVFDKNCDDATRRLTGVVENDTWQCIK